MYLRLGTLHESLENKRTLYVKFEDTMLVETPG